MAELLIAAQSLSHIVTHEFAVFRMDPFVRRFFGCAVVNHSSPNLGFRTLVSISVDQARPGFGLQSVGGSRTA
jgi:hypothetical protein